MGNVDYHYMRMFQDLLLLCRCDFWPRLCFHRHKQVFLFMWSLFKMSFLSFSIAFSKGISIISFWTLSKTSTSALPRFPSLHLILIQERDVGMPRFPLPKKENGPGCYTDHRPGALLWTFLPLQIITILDMIILSDVMIDCIILIAKHFLHYPLAPSCLQGGH